MQTIQAHRVSAAYRARGRRKAVHVYADLGLSKLPLWFSPKAMLPLSKGAIRVHEQRFIDMFNDLQLRLLERPGTKMRFGHIIGAAHAPSALLASSEHAVGGHPRIGCVAHVTSLQRRDDGTLKIEFELARRFCILNLAPETTFPVAYAMTYSDNSEGLSPLERQGLDELEQEVYRCLLDIESLTRRLQMREQGANDGTNSKPSGLPCDVKKYAPPPPSTRTTAEALRDAGYAAGYDMLMWQRHGSVYRGDTRGRSSTAVEPYAHVSKELLGKEQRQELFSFAALSLVEGLGNAECLALLHSQDTAARLHWVQAAVEPYMRELQAKLSVAKALTTN